jgi:predicted nucleotidyltransferase
MQKIQLLTAIVGSKAYGTNTPESDIDLKGVYIQHPLEVLSYNEYIEQLIPDKDTTHWEVSRFIELLCKSNPTVLELLFTPEDCILEKHPLFDLLIKKVYVSKINNDRKHIELNIIFNFDNSSKKVVYKGDKNFNSQSPYIDSNGTRC